MIDSDLRCSILKELQDVIQIAPEVRIGQLLAHLGDLSLLTTGRELGNLENDEFLRLLMQHHAELRQRACPDPIELPLQTHVFSVSK